MTSYKTDFEKSNLSKDKIFKYAEEKAESLGYKVGGDLRKLLSKNFPESSLKFLNDDEREGYISGKIEVDGRNKFTIYLANFTGELRDRFTIAHELGHYYLHSDEGRTQIITARDVGGDRETEVQADCFAMAFLMPEEEFLKWDKKFGEEDLEMASKFQLSISEINVRRNSLKKNSISKFDFTKEKRLVLFLSADLIGSSSYKYHKSSEVSLGWYAEIYNFFSSFPVTLNDELKNEELQKEILKRGELENFKKVSRVWKKLGDEIIFYFELNNFQEAEFYIHCFSNAIKTYNNKKYNLKVKGTAWTAGFPVDNLVITDSFKNVMNNKLDDKSITNQIDFIGPSMDAGFRLSKYSTANRLVISVELAYILTKNLNHASKKGLVFHVEGEQYLKGIIEGQGYPIFWLEVNRTPYNNLINREKLDVREVCQYAKNFILEKKKSLLPFTSIGKSENKEYNERYKKLCFALRNLDIAEIDITREVISNNTFINHQ